MELKDGCRVKFKNEYHHAVSNYDVKISVGETGTVRRNIPEVISIKLDDDKGTDLDEWDNCVHIDPETFEGHVAEMDVFLTEHVEVIGTS